MKRKTVIFLGDGMADEPVPALGGLTPLQVARKPGMDSIARDGRSGTLFTLPDRFPTSSEVANMSVLGCDLASEYCGRGPLEAAGRGIPLGSDDKVFRLNLVTQKDGILTDFSGGHIAGEDAAELVGALNDNFGAADVRFHSGVSYRNLLVLSGPKYSAKIKAEKPDDNQGERISDHLPVAALPESEHTAAYLSDLMLRAQSVLEKHPVNKRLLNEGKSMANGVWPWSGGKAGALKTLKNKYGITSAVITAVDVISGLGKCLGMDVIKVPGATGYIDTNYEGKADAALDALGTHDFVFVHVEAIDEVSHEGNLVKKVAAIEDFDSRLISRVLCGIGGDVSVAVLADHPVPVRLRKHTRTPVPLSVRLAGVFPDDVQTYDEKACLHGALGALSNGDLMALLFGRPKE